MTTILLSLQYYRGRVPCVVDDAHAHKAIICYYRKQLAETDYTHCDSVCGAEEDDCRPHSVSSTACM